MKTDGRLDRNFLAGTRCDAINALLRRRILLGGIHWAHLGSIQSALTPLLRKLFEDRAYTGPSIATCQAW